MDALFTLFLVLFISLIVTRIATTALVQTGMSKEMARLQSRSALTGCGFTTIEWEKMVNHPIRRKILMRIMLFGNIGVVAALSTTVIGFMDGGTGTESYLFKIILTIIGLLVLYVISKSKIFDYYLTKLISKFLKFYFKGYEFDYEHILHLSNNFKIAELYVNKKDWFAGKSIGSIESSSDGIKILGIQHKTEEYIGFPNSNLQIKRNDTITIYGKKRSIYNFKKML